MTFWKWSQTASTNGTADSTCPFPEGMAPSAVNDGIRGAMAALAKYRDDIGGLTTTAGTNTAYTYSSFQLFDSFAHMNGAMIAFAPHTTNGATVTLNVDGLGVKPLRSAPGVELLAATIIQGTPYAATYNNATGEWILQGLYGNPYNVPMLGGMDYWDTVAPNSSFIFPLGQALSRAIYAAAFARLGTTYGAGDGSTTFNVPDLAGRIRVMKEASASRLTSSYFGGNSTVMGATGGGESITLSTGNLPPYTPSGSTSVTIQHNGLAVSLGGTDVYTTAGGGGSVGIPSSFTGNAQGGSSAPVRTVQPTIVCNYIIRII
jgi:microcystin-dependent protein